ncbi:transglutaminase domain-containing protein [Chitinivorax sp. B]|uniref:transglutaminase domain-containing protein n=1 Tax=Chitinivorax sp. B TaxID=2502235 RepID=UPI0010F75B1A|nr:transglutaminase domain-containing protein [Chitinivorax sp. B]
MNPVRNYLKLVPLGCFLSMLTTHATSIYTNRDFSAIDLHALRAPDSASDTPETLVRYLIGPAKDDVDKARSIFRWLANNIEYDTDGFFSGHYGDLKPASVLKRRKAVCTGYTDLFAILAKQAGLNVVTVRGYVKDVAHSDGEPFTDTNHDWIAIELNGHWHLIEPTWGAGGVDDTGRFKKQFSPQYFLAQPDDLADTHFAEDSRWRATTHSSLGAFLQRIRPFPSYYQYQLSDPSEMSYRVHIPCSGWRLTLHAPDDVYLTSSLEQGNRNFEQQTFIQRLSGRHHILVSAPQPGEYLLRVFAKRKSEPGHVFAQALRYRLIFEQGSSFQFPVHFVTLREHAGTLLAPLRSTLKLGSTVLFAVGLPEAKSVMVSNGSNPWTELKQEAFGVYEGPVEIKGSTVVLAKFDEHSNDYLNLVSYAVVSDPNPVGFMTCQPGME